MRASGLADLRPLIEAAFPLEPIPRAPIIAAYDDEDIIPTFLGRPWNSFSVKELRAHEAAIAFLTDEAFAYYLPAFLTATVDDPDGADVIPDHLLVKFARADAAPVVARLGHEQRQVLLRFFREYVDDDPCYLRDLAGVMDHLDPGWNDSPVHRRVTILVAGLRSWPVPPAGQLTSLVDQVAAFRHAAHSAVVEHGGAVTRSIGDALIAVWPGQPLEAADAAFTISRRARELSAESDWTVSQSLEASIGIAEADYTTSREEAVLKATAAASELQRTCQRRAARVAVDDRIASALPARYRLEPVELDDSGSSAKVFLVTEDGA